MTSRQHALYDRYMAAFNEWNWHQAACACGPQRPCPAGVPLLERASRLQDAWNNHLSKQQR
jgi:hypothetical protein